MSQLRRMMSSSSDSESDDEDENEEIADLAPMRIRD